VYTFNTGPHEEALDGAFFGTSFAHMFIMSFDRWMPEVNTREVYTPRIFGFKVIRLCTVLSSFH
jgi:Casein kinase II regulatory subunit